LVFDPNGAFSLFVSGPKLVIPIESEAPPTHSTDLANSVFFRPDKKNPEVIVPARQAASAVILVPILIDEIRPIGLLHPAPTMPLNLDDWYQVPFIRLKNGRPIRNGKIGIEWTIPHGTFPHIHRRLQLPKNPFKV
jgi:hypothetical protein